MNANAVPQAAVKNVAGRFALLASLALVMLMVGLLGGTAVAAPVVGKDGKVQACYRVKGKAKGAMRVVPAGKKCRRGERKLAWNVAGSSGIAGPTGAKGTNGSNGTAGPAGPAGPSGSSNEAALQAKISSLTLKVEGLETILSGVTNGQLTSTINKLTGITGLELTETVGALPVVDSLCTQAAAVPGQINSVGTALGGLTLGGLIPGGLVLTIPSLTPAAPFTC